MMYYPSRIQVIKYMPGPSEDECSCILAKSVPADIACLVTLGGALTNSPHTANSYSHEIYSLVPKDIAPQVNLYSVAYDFGSYNRYLAREELFNRTDKYIKSKYNNDPVMKKYLIDLYHTMQQKEPVPQYVQEIFDTFIYPRISPAHDINATIKNLQRITFYAHCYGAVVLCQLSKYMHEQMHDMGYTDPEISQAQRAIFAVQHSPIAPLTTHSFSTVSFASAADVQMHKYSNMFSQWLLKNRGKIPPCFFDKPYGNFFITDQLTELSFREHEPLGLLKPNNQMWELTDNGEIIFSAERNALVNMIRQSVIQCPQMTIADLVSGQNVNFAEMKKHGEELYKTMLGQLRRQNQAHGRQK